jgi:hypothetical protein
LGCVGTIMFQIIVNRRGRWNSLPLFLKNGQILNNLQFVNEAKNAQRLHKRILFKFT